MSSAGLAALALAATLAVLCAPSARGKVYDRCELARELAGRLGVPVSATATWVCIAYHESRFDTTAIGRLNYDSSLDHGLFQISDIYWCSHNPEGGKACNLPCTSLRDEDLTDDLACALQIHKEHTGLSGDGFNAWTVYRLYCDGNVKKYVAGCYDKEFPGQKVTYYDDSVFDTVESNSTTIDISENLIYKYSPAPAARPVATLFDIDKLLPITTAKYQPTESSSRGAELSLDKSTTRTYFEITSVKSETKKEYEDYTKTTPSTTVQTYSTRKPYTPSYTFPTIPTAKPFTYKTPSKFPTYKPYSASAATRTTTPVYKTTSTTQPPTTTANIKPTYYYATSKKPFITTTKKSYFTTTKKPYFISTYKPFFTTRNSVFSSTTNKPTAVTTNRPITTTYKPFTSTKRYVFSTTNGLISKITRSKVIHIQIFPLPTSSPENSQTTSHSTERTSTPSINSFNWTSKRLPVINSSKYQTSTERYKFSTTAYQKPVTKNPYGVTFKFPSIFNKSEPIQKSVFGFGTALNSLSVKKNTSVLSVVKTTDNNKSETQSQRPFLLKNTQSAFRFN